MNELVSLTKEKQWPRREGAIEQNQAFLSGVETANRILEDLYLPLIDPNAFIVLPDDRYGGGFLKTLLRRFHDRLIERPSERFVERCRSMKH